MTDEGGRHNTADEGSTELAGGTDEPYVDVVFTALSDWRRRELVQYFRDTAADTATVDELALLIGAYEPDGTGGASRPHDDIVAALTGTHLPLLAASGVLEYDGRSETVRYQGQPTVEKWIDHVRAVDRRAGEDVV